MSPAAFWSRIVVYATHIKLSIASVRYQILPCVLLILLLAGISSADEAQPPLFDGRFRSSSWVRCWSVFWPGLPNWLRYGIGVVKTGITYAPGEVRGLRRLGELMTPDERFATNKHALDMESLAPPNERSYGYSALSERPVLLEGYLARGENLLPWFKLCFTTTTCSSVLPTRKRCGALPKLIVSDGLSPIPAPTYRCQGHCPLGWLSSKTAETLGSTGSTNPTRSHGLQAWPC